MWFNHLDMCPKDAERMANSVNPDQTQTQEQPDLGEDLGLSVPKFRTVINVIMT